MFYLLHQVLHNTRYCTQTVNFSLPSLLRCLQRGEKKVQKKLVFAGRSYNEKRKFWKPSVHSQGLQFTSFSSKPFFWNHGFSENHGFKKNIVFWVVVDGPYLRYCTLVLLLSVWCLRRHLCLCPCTQVHRLSITPWILIFDDFGSRTTCIEAEDSQSCAYAQFTFSNRRTLSIESYLHCYINS